MTSLQTPTTPTSPSSKSTSKVPPIPERDSLPINLNLLLSNILGSILLLFGVAIGSYASQLTLGPVYGGIPASLHHRKICTAIFAIVWGSKAILRRVNPRPLWILPILAFYVPVIQRTLFQYSEKWGAEWGPIYTELLSYYPTLFLAILGVSYLVEMPRLALDIIPAGASYGIFKLVRDNLPSLLAHRIGSTWIFTRCGLTNLAAGLYGLLSPAALLLAIPGMIHSGYYNPGCTKAAGIRYLNATLAAQNYTVLARAESLTGYISVIENTFERYKVMRCDHSLLGGEWLMPPPGLEYLANGEKETIYPVFVMLEAVRLIRPGPAARNPKALMIGLGIGTSHNGMMRHGVETHLVELDPMVYQYAKDYFHLLPNHTAHIMDAVKFVQDASSVEKPKQWDFIIHDVFTGGAVPSVLFTTDMMQGMGKILKDDGVIAINYAGDLNQRPAKMVIETIRSVFGHCKVFREDDPGDEEKAIDFTNMVIFCTKSTAPFRFRPAFEKDYLNTYSRQSFLYPKFEVDLVKLFGKDGNREPYDVLDGRTIEEFEEMQRRGAVHHWEIMRTVIKKEGWENY
ncbi:S-adenosyl-L-methionine-dependent methyltransferase [Terfezia claveryi]|nr:S-adenosyl-L-methionine-dependent methyltransferase [Terfezia claveryi]